MPLKLGAGRVAEAAVVIERQRAVGRAADDAGRKRIAIDIAVVGEDAAGRIDRQRRTLIERIGIVGARRRVVDRAHTDRHGRRIAGRRAVAGLIDERVAAVEVGVRARS